MGIPKWLSLWACCLLLICSQSYAQHARKLAFPSQISSNDYAPQTLIVKLKAQNSARRSQSQNTLQTISQWLRPEQLEQALPSSTLAASKSANVRANVPNLHLDNIYKLKLPAGQSLEEAIQKLSQLENVEYAEPYYLMKPLGTLADEYVPDDPAAAKSGAQKYLSLINAYEAWAIEKGESSIVIGILDTGVDLGHEDLADNLWRNADDPINGIDDDNDGYVDNYLGWDFADLDNDPTADQNVHGVEVNGIAAASTNNETGIAGTGFNSAYLPVKIFKSSNGNFYNGYEAIAYAADMGCKVINLSWGGANAYSNFGQDIINYAVLVKDAVVVSAAGNSGVFEDFYPASFDHVLSVAQTDTNDKIRSATTSSYFVDLTAPGQNVYTTRSGDTYANSSGSSMATPQVAGAAALLRAHYPEMNALQVMEKLRISSDDIYAIGLNNQHQEKLGRGRLNMGKALKDADSPALRMSGFSYRNHVGPYAYYKDTLSIQASFTNYLSPTSSDAKVTLSSPSEYVSILDSTFILGTLNTLENVEMGQQAFRVYLHEDLPSNEQIYFRLSFEDGEYTDYQYFFIVSSQNNIQLDNGKIRLAVSGSGDIGQGFSGESLVVNGVQWANSLGLAVGTDIDSVSDNIINSLTLPIHSWDFTTVESLRFVESEQADILLSSVFNDADATASLNLRVEQQWLTNTSGLGQDYLISEYRIIKEEENSVYDLNVGVFADWDLGDSTKNKAAWDASHTMGYVYSDTLYAGLALLSDHSPNYYAIDKKNQEGNVADLGVSLSDSIRYAWMSQGIAKASAGTEGAGNDVAHMLSATIDTLASWAHSHVAFAYLTGESLEELQTLATAAKAHYEAFRANPPLLQTQYACIDSSVVIQPKVKGLYRFYKDAFGTELIAEDSILNLEALEGDTAIFITSMELGYEGQMRQIKVKMLYPEADFTVHTVSKGSFKNDTLFLSTEDAATIKWKDLSRDAASWSWDFGNGYKSTQESPSVKFSEEGRYIINLKVSSIAGCEDVTSKEITVVKRALPAEVKDQLICSGEKITIVAANTDQIAVYSDKSLKNLLFSGKSYTTDNLTKDVTYFVVNENTTYPSIAVPLSVSVLQAEVNIKHELYLSNESKYMLKIWAESDAKLSDMEWVVDNITVNRSDTLYYDYTEQHNAMHAVNVELKYIHIDGISCNQHSKKTIDILKSPKPFFQDQQVCRGEAVKLAPTQGKNFYFYNDASLSAPVHRGKSYIVEEFETEQTFYITNIDSLGESEAAEVKVAFNKFADFNIVEDTIFLTENNEAVFEAFSFGQETSNISWSWDLGNGEYTTRGASVKQTYDSIGVYPITLIAQNSEGCTNTVTKLLTVVNVTAANEDPEEKNLQLYPNPSEGSLWLCNKIWYQKEVVLSLKNAQGKEVCRKAIMYHNFPVKINLNEIAQQQLPEGVYMIELLSTGKRFYRKLLLKR